MKTKSQNKLKQVYKTGGAFKPNSQLTAGTEAAAAVTNPLVDLVDSGNSYGRQTGLSSGLKMGSQFAAAGAALGPAGAIAGGALGLGVGLIGSIGAKKKEQAMDRQLAFEQNDLTLQQGNAKVAADPSLLYGNKNSQMFKAGGDLPKPGTVVPPAKSKIIVQKKDGRLDQWGNDIVYKDYAKGYQPDNVALPPVQVAPMGNISPTLIQSGQKFQGSPATTKLIEERERQLRANSKYENGGQLVPLNKQAVEVQGASHEQGGVQIPGAEVEGGETISKGFVFSEALGTAQLHKPIAKAIGKLEKKPLTGIRKRTMEVLNQREQDLATAQETFKQQLGIK